MIVDEEKLPRQTMIILRPRLIINGGLVDNAPVNIAQAGISLIH